jgi:hypothetical protein
MDHGSTEWKDGLLEVTLFRDRSSHINWLNSQARKDLSIGVKQEDPTMAPIFESKLKPEALIESSGAWRSCGSIELRIKSSYSEPELEIESSHSELELGIELGIESSHS